MIAFLKEPARHALYSEGIPDDARIVAVDWGYPGVIVLAIESQSFEEVKQGQCIPEMSPVLFHRI
jgi:hypothetical protein